MAGQLFLPVLTQTFFAAFRYDQPVGVLDLLKMGDLVERFTVGETQMIRVLASALVWQTNLARQVGVLRVTYY